jgi:hypothetical protein
MSADEGYKIIAQRDGITAEQAQVLVYMWSWPIGLAIHPAYQKALAGHPDWHAWRTAPRDSIPSLDEWTAWSKTQ